MTVIPTSDELLEKTDFEAKGHFIKSRFPYTYAYDFVRMTPGIIPDEIHETLMDMPFNCMSRADAGVYVHEWAAYESWDYEELVLRLARAYCKYFRIDVPVVIGV